MTTRKDSVNSDQDKMDKIPSHYDPHLVPSETAAREAREGTRFAQVEHDDAKDTEHIHTRDGYTVDPEGLINNYAVEPPMYVNEPGDLAEEEEIVAQQRAAERDALSKDEEGNLSPKTNWQHKGPGMI
ncbi:hypothetical protein S7335_4999 [Synechococcus sp. PCC 7335]|uniref:hypothetical protein n=1 Tax=Synechococcus sp. (strain ATCC 29403 / PCC 7335) TaxID=91464 RepID=UPI00017ECEBD|nr:hypothetical protein [Synechococcus sp. PCC 7335]EDX87291.1 hypothetical protein S7335_4999 [Synechococcus sp. PCC 7335]